MAKDQRPKTVLNQVSENNVISFHSGLNPPEPPKTIAAPSGNL